MNVVPLDTCNIRRPTVSHNASCLSLIRLKPVVRIFPSVRNTALMGLVPSWTFSLTCRSNGETEGRVAPLDHFDSCTYTSTTVFYMCTCTRCKKSNSPWGRCPFAGRWRAGPCLCRRCRGHCRPCSSSHCRSGLDGRRSAGTQARRCPRSTRKWHYHSLKKGERVARLVHMRWKISSGVLLTFLPGHVELT